jgi:hypothetical protein
VLHLKRIVFSVEVNALRPVYSALLILLPVCVAYPSVGLTVVLQIDERYSESSIGEMKAEAQALVKDSGVVLNWRLIDTVSSSEAFPRMVVVRLRGTCDMSLPVPRFSPGPLGSTYILGGEPGPFSDIECDRIRSSVAAPAGRADLTFGRALGRVLAHELHHVIERTQCHTATGYTRQSLSAAELIADRRNLNKR